MARTSFDAATFAAAQHFPLDRFQTEAIASLDAGRSVLVSAPTGAGKTIIGEYAVARALAAGGKAFYTTPLKALSNQKFGDFVAIHGAHDVGLLTGDNTINGDARAVVMTTEVLRNMLYDRSGALQGLEVVVMDEVHYLKDPYRGGVWEEILILLPQDVAIVALSATVSNADEFGAWLTEVRGQTDVIVEQKRPVPIDHRYLDTHGLHEMFVDGKPNPALLRRSARDDHDRHRRGRVPRIRTPDRIEVVDRLKDAGMLPAIYFLFSRAGCDQGVRTCRAANLSLTTTEEQHRIREYLAMRTGLIPREDHAVLELDAWADALEHGIGAHHAGLIPPCKEALEELFEAGLVRLVFATETLALGVNMPARAVVIERLKKFNGERHEVISSGDYLQLTGRAGRRGKDEVGYGVCLSQSDLAFGRIALLASGRSFPLTSSFKASYNMTVSLLRHHTVEEAERLLDLSFAQFLADRGVVGERHRIEEGARALDGYRERLACSCGEAAEVEAYVRAWLRADVADAPAKGEAARSVRDAIGRLRVGDVVLLKHGKRAAVVDLRRAKQGGPAALALTADRRLVRLGTRDFSGPPEVIGKVHVPKGDVRSGRIRGEVGDALRTFKRLTGDGSDEAARPAPTHDARAAMRRHPTHTCPERNDHLRWGKRIVELERDTERLQRRVRARTGTLASDLRRVLQVLGALGYVEDGVNTDRGARLARIFCEQDLLVAEAVHDGTLDALTSEELAATVSAFVYQSRPADAVTGPPPAAVRRAFIRLSRTFRDVRAQEQEVGLSIVREPDAGFALPMYRWASGDDLEDVLDIAGCTAGDFVRNTKQTWDLLRQIAEVAPDEGLATRARSAARSIYRGVVAYAGTL